MVSDAKQEQAPASDEVVEIAEGVLRTQLPIEFTGLGHVNMYVLLDSRGAAVVDPGMPLDGSYRAVVDRLRLCGLTPTDVHTIVVTHSHPDHFGGAGRLAEEGGGTVIAHEGFTVPWGPEPDVATINDPGITLGLGVDGTRVPWRGIDDRMAVPTFDGDAHAARGRLPAPRIARSVVDGEGVELAGRTWTVLHTPGHTSDHICLHDEEASLLLTGDHVLPTITPHISGAFNGNDPLQRYLHQLGRMSDLPIGTSGLPAHGGPIGDLAARAAVIAAHHNKRLDQVCDAARALGLAPVHAFAEALFPPQHLGLMAESETYAHLEHLRARGLFSVDRSSGIPLYDLRPV